MRNADRTSQYSDEDCLEGVLCTSCRLAVNKDTGRLKWCMGGNDIWRARIRYMLLIPTIILPIMIIFIVLSRSNISGRNVLQSTQGVEDNRLDGVVSRQRFVSAESLNADDQVPSTHIETSFEPVAFQNFGRHKRHLKTGTSAPSLGGNDVHYRPRMTSYDPNLETSYDEDAIRGLKKRNLDKDYHDVLQELQSDKNKSKSYGEDYEDYYDNAYEDTTELEVYEEEIDYPNDSEDDELTDTSKTVANDFKDSDDSWQKEEVEDEGIPQGPCETDEEEREMDFENVPSLSVDDAAADESPEFHSFWKGEGNEHSIRKQQAKMMLKYMDRTANPCEDFYQYSCGNWAKYNPIPKYKVGYDTFEMLRESLHLVLKELLEEPMARSMRHSPGSAVLKAKNLYRSCMNREILEQRREKPLLRLLDDLGGWPILKPDWDPTNFDLLDLIGNLRLYNINILISVYISPLNTANSSDLYIIQLDETSLGLPTRDYFLQPSYKAYLEAYKTYFIKIATLLGAPMKTSVAIANEIVEFEVELAKITGSTEDKLRGHTLFTLQELQSRIPELDWQRYLTIIINREITPDERVSVLALNYIQNLVMLLSKTPSRTVANYVLWRFIRLRVNNLDERFQEAKQKFFSVVFGREQAPPRWKTCVSQVNANMGMAVGSLFVQRYFDENSKQDTLTMMQELQQTFREILNKTCWIDDETKELAIEKVNAMLLKIGYPDYILNQKLLNEHYEDVVIHPDKYFENTLNILKYLTKADQYRLGTTVNKTLWNTPPSIVNAYYSRYKNQIIVPAGILQPPFYHKHFPKSLNYGGIGVIIGHEITHGFDNKGRLFDQNGNLKRWWTDDVIKGFQERAQCLIDQYNKYTVSEVNMQVNGINTQGENIADNGGIKQAYNAYEKWLSLNGDSKETLPGIKASGRQLFFLNFAQVWCGSLRPETTRNNLKIAKHSPGKYRVIGTLSNFKEFAQVFKCPTGSPMNPTKKCAVW